MIQKGTITKIEGRRVWVSVAPLGCCSGEDSGGGCNCASTTAEVEFKAINSKDLSLTLGDSVEVSSPMGAAWGGILRLVLVPAVLFLVGMFVWTSWVGLALAVAGLAASLLFPQSRDSGFPQVEQVLPFGEATPFGAKA